jgi:hypothetical protein
MLITLACHTYLTSEKITEELAQMGVVQLVRLDACKREGGNSSRGLAEEQFDLR